MRASESERERLREREGEKEAEAQLLKEVKSLVRLNQLGGCLSSFLVKDCASVCVCVCVGKALAVTVAWIRKRFG